MNRVRFGAIWAAAVVVAAAGAESALAQHKTPPAPAQGGPAPGAMPSVNIPSQVGPPPGSMPQFDPDQYQRSQDSTNQIEKNLPSNPAANAVNQITAGWPSPETLMLLMEIGFGIIVFVLLLWGGTQVYMRYARPRDPMKYVMSDPWVQAQFARQGVPPDQRPQPPA